MIRIGAPNIESIPIFILLGICILISSPAFANDERNDSTAAKGVVSIDAFDSSAPGNEFSLGTASQYADRVGKNPDQAIMICRKALEKNNDDIDLHLHYAELLEEKFNDQGKSDPTLYMDCVKEWLVVVRGEAGDERGLTFHGIGLPFTGMYYNDEDRVISARKHLLDLTGVTPKGWETDAKYLQKVSRHSSVGGKILPKETQSKKADVAM